MLLRSGSGKRSSRVDPQVDASHQHACTTAHNLCPCFVNALGSALGGNVQSKPAWRLLPLSLSLDMLSRVMQGLAGDAHGLS